MTTITRQHVPALLYPPIPQRKLRASELVKKAVLIIEKEIDYVNLSDATKFNLQEATKRVLDEIR